MNHKIIPFKPPFERTTPELNRNWKNWGVDIAESILNFKSGKICTIEQKHHTNKSGN